jgi:phosphate transport system permease protein
LAIAFAVPVSVLTALFISKMAPKRLGKIFTSVVELLASIPSIIYGIFGMGVITVLIKNISQFFGYQSAGGLSTLATVLVLAMMIMPTVTILSVTSMNAVKQNIINGSLALGASPTQTNFRVVLASAKSGIFSAIILGVGRALGEATAVSMVAGNRGSGPTFNLFDTTRTLTSTMLLGLKETAGLDYDIRFSVGIVLIVIILITNIGLNYIKGRLGDLR